jgi:F-type H+-transporting ATPase subunit delta
VSFTKKVVTTYAKSLFQNVSIAQNAKQKIQGSTITELTPFLQRTIIPNVYITGEEILLISSTITSTKKLNEFFKNPTYAEQQKLDVLISIFPGLTVMMKSFLKVLAERSHLSLIPEISEEYTKILLKFKNTTKVKLVTASGLKESSGALLLTTLKKLTGAKEVILTVSYDPKILGGLILEYNSLSIDASVLKEFSLFFSEV